MTSKKLRVVAVKADQEFDIIVITCTGSLTRRPNNAFAGAVTHKFKPAEFREDEADDFVLLVIIMYAINHGVQRVLLAATSQGTICTLQLRRRTYAEREEHAKALQLVLGIPG